jgi:hypothetical protein
LLVALQQHATKVRGHADAYHARWHPCISKRTNPVAFYAFIYDDNMLGPFLRKLLFYHVEIAYFYVLCRTMGLATDSYDSATSLFGSAWACLWVVLLVLHFTSFQIGIYVAVNHYHELSHELFVFIPFIGRMAMDVIAMRFFLLFVTSFGLIFSLSTLDIVLFSIWNLYFYHCRVEFRQLSHLTSPKCDSMWEGFSVALVFICLIHFVGLNSYFVTALIVGTGIFLYCMAAYLSRPRPLFRRDVETYKAIGWIFLFSFCIQFVFYSSGLISMIILAALQAVVLPLVFDFLNTPSLDDILHHLFDAVTVLYWRDRFTDLALKARYFQFFTAYYLLRLILVLWTRL